jgi:hypothetical protein
MMYIYDVPAGGIRLLGQDGRIGAFSGRRRVRLGWHFSNVQAASAGSCPDPISLDIFLELIEFLEIGDKVEIEFIRSCMRG